MKKYGICFTACLLLLISAHGRTVPLQDRRQEQRWIDSVMHTLTPRQRIAQLFIIPIETLPEQQKKIDKIAKIVDTEQIGGLIVMKAQPHYYADVINRIQSISKVPLLITMDAEWGVNMRMDSIMPFPRQMMLGAISDNTMIEKMGEAIAEQCKRMGVQVDYAPVVDVNNNPDNPVINIRSFGENKYNVAEKSIAYMHGLQNKGILACAKHFPGHGDTNQDSHETLPSITHSSSRMDSIELYPFKALMEAGVDAVMVAHLQVPAYDTLKRPSTLSRPIVSQLLKDELEFSGLTVTDALNMKAVTSCAKNDSLAVALAALLAGNDILLMPDNISTSIDHIEKAIRDGKISEHKINTKCRKMLAAKYRAGLSHYEPVNSTGLAAELNSPDNEALRYQLTEKALTLLHNSDSLLPLQRLDTLKIAYLEIGKNGGTAFKNQLQYYAGFDSFSIDPVSPKDTLHKLYNALAPYNLIIVGYHHVNARPQANFGVDSATAQFVTKLAAEKRVILGFFGTPYGIRRFADYRNLSALIIAYENTVFSQERTAQLIFGGVAAQGTLPVSIDSVWCFGNGIRQTATTRLRYVVPEEAGIPRRQLASIDTLVAEAIEQGATPGAQVMAIHKGNVFYHKSFGHHSYDSAATPVTSTDVYDWASITKISATLPVLMKLKDEERIDITASLGTYVPLLVYTNKSPLRIDELLIHASGLKAFQPFQLSFFPDKAAGARLDSAYFSRTCSERYPWQVADSLYASDKVSEHILKAVDASPLLRKTYRYSDWGFMYLKEAIENRAGAPLDRLADSLFYRPLGMTNTGYLPLLRMEKGRIPPTETDMAFRRQRVQGTVHDPTAALLGGVAGHAGVFGNANDLAKLLQMYLNGGVYGGERYLADSTLHLFTQCYACDRGIRRGLGFDKPELRKDKDSPVGREWSPESYGHSGYTGNLCWVDPERELIVIFLSNRSFPNDDKLLNRLNTRGKIFSEFVNIIDDLD
jgi:beta-glucosidase-like glycosyl hydrolase/CubicO group peptidase (beta-lactamase class C family)